MTMILWVDDDTTTSLQAFIDELEEEGYHVLMAKDPSEMNEMINQNIDKITGIIMDIMLPIGNMDSKDANMGFRTGLVLLKELKINKKTKDIPMIIFTIADDPKVKSWAKSERVPFLAKQETFPDELLQQINLLNLRKDNE